MNLKYRFATLFSLCVFIILLCSFTFIYLLCEKFRKDDFFTRLRSEAVKREQLFKQTGGLGNELPTSLETRNESTFFGEKVLIADSAGIIRLKNPASVNRTFHKNLFARAKRGEVFFEDEMRDGLIIPFKHQNKTYFVIIAAYDKIGIRKVEFLKYALIITLIGGFVLSALIAFFFVKQMMKPIAELDSEMQNITEKRLDARVDESRRNDELGRIAKNFNGMLNRLQRAFDMQKSFVQHASHELRTPIASMLTQTEAVLNKDVPNDELKKVLHSLREDQLAMSELINSLLLLSKYEAFSINGQFFPVRVDEVLYETIESFKEDHPKFVIHLNFLTVPENSELLTIKGNDTLLQTAISNLIRNAYLYSDDLTLSISIAADANGIEIVFENKGQQLTDIEKERLFVPFFRGDNAMMVKGTGLGLSIVHRIATLHGGTIAYDSVGERLNKFTLRFNP